MIGAPTTREPEALGEAVETAAALESSVATIGARLRGLTGALDPRAVGLYPAPRYRRPGFPYRRFDPGRRIRWEQGRWLDDGAPVHVPVGLVRYDERDGLCQATSNGLAAGRTFEDAARAALQELLERDALLAHWLAGRPGRRVAGDAELVLLDAAIDLPVVACVVLGDGRTTPAVTVGAACRANAADAAAHARREAASVGGVLQGALRSGYPVPPALALRSPLDHGLLRLRRGQAAARSLLGDETLPLDAVPLGPASLEDLVAALGGAGLRPAVVELDAPDGWHVIRAVVPGLQPLWFGAHLQRSLTPRMRALAGGHPRRAAHPLA